MKFCFITPVLLTKIKKYIYIYMKHECRPFCNVDVYWTLEGFSRYYWSYSMIHFLYILFHYNNNIRNYVTVAYYTEKNSSFNCNSVLFFGGYIVSLVRAHWKKSHFKFPESRAVRSYTLDLSTSLKSAVRFQFLFRKIIFVHPTRVLYVTMPVPNKWFMIMTNRLNLLGRWCVF